MKKVGFLVFFMMWAEMMRWQVPVLHVHICRWLEETLEPVRVLLVFRGAAKSTIYAIYKAWRLYLDPERRSLIWSEDGRLSRKMTRDTIQILRRHPLCRGLLPQKPGVEEFWVSGAVDARNPSMAAYGVLSNATGSRADDVDFDDIEVPKNIKTPEAREKLRERISESTHIIVPGGQKTYIGTPHTHESVYDEQIEGGAAVLKIPLFSHHARFEEDADTHRKTRFRFNFPLLADGLYVFTGIHKFAKLLTQGRDYRIEKGHVVLPKPPGNVLDIYSGCAWPERFNRKDLERRRKDTRTLNAWDSQYGLESKPLHAIRLDPERLVPYEVSPAIHNANGSVRMMLGKTRIVSATARWDCALGRVTGDISAFSVFLQDEAGNYYWQVAQSLTGDGEEQSAQIREHVIALQLPRVVVETNGPGAFLPAILRKTLAGTGCGVGEEFTKVNKNTRILEAFEAPLLGGFLWAHVDVIDTVWEEMKDWKAVVKEQPDNFLDAAAGAIKDQPMRLGRVIGTPKQLKRDDWRPSAGTHEVTLDLAGD